MFQKKVFKNKVRLITVPSKDTKAVTVLFLFGVGSRYENMNINGVSHFIEHLMFKGTKKRPTTLDISKDLDRVGAEFNAMTSKDYTGYYVKINAKNGDLAIDILSDMLLNSKFDSAEINRERGVIVEEINMYHDNPLMSIESLLEEEVFKGNSLGWDIAGPSSVIKKVTRKQLLDFRNQYYRADNVVIAVAGRFTEQTKKLLETKFVNKISVRSKSDQDDYRGFVSIQKSLRINLKFRQTRQVQLAIGFPSFGYNDKRTYAMHLLSIILGGNMSSRLFIQVRERRGLCYFVRAYPNFYQDTGNFVVQSGLDASRLEEAITVILSELKKIKQKGVTAKELRDAKEFIQGKIVLGLEDSSSLAEYYAKQELLTGKTMSPEQKMKLYQAVKPADILAVAKEIFVAEKFNMALIGPFKNKKKFEKLIKL